MHSSRTSGRQRRCHLLIHLSCYVMFEAYCQWYSRNGTMALFANFLTFYSPGFSCGICDRLRWCGWGKGNGQRQLGPGRMSHQTTERGRQKKGSKSRRVSKKTDEGRESFLKVML
ncbi:uncharacterized protein B0T15DRAFT_58567 [Chaetomium strumarium]|uniref:Uncharacterized protein n=1 Tax=Chaetomium strumarium TaxID=1170767 RepID=A0AAJ0H3T3_9PEZI|nr:hypothetical protein B0T15DRAFT_58567 [Chaetomium strumarium]